jgi:hypothetical protein
MADADVRQSIANFGAAPDINSFSAMNAALQYNLNGRCFNNIRDVETESGEATGVVVADRLPLDPSNPFGFLAWLAALFATKQSKSLTRALVLLSYASYVSSENPDLFIHALYCLYYAEIADTGALVIDDYESIMRAWDTSEHIAGQIVPHKAMGPNSYRSLMSAMSVPTAEGGAGHSLALSFPGDLTADPTADDFIDPQPNPNWNNTPCAADPPIPSTPIVDPLIPIHILPNPPGLFPINILPGNDPGKVDPGKVPDGPGPTPPGGGHHGGGGGGGGGGDDVIDDGGGDYVPPPPKGRPPPGPTEGGSSGILLLLLIIVVIGIVASQRR